MDIAGAYVGIEPPEVRVDRDFDLQVLDPAQIGQYMSMWTQGAITHETLRRCSKLGDAYLTSMWREVELVNQSKLNDLDLNSVGGSLAEDSEDPKLEDDKEESPLSVRRSSAGCWKTTTMRRTKNEPLKLVP